MVKFAARQFGVLHRDDFLQYGAALLIFGKVHVEKTHSQLFNVVSLSRSNYYLPEC